MQNALSTASSRLDNTGAVTVCAGPARPVHEVRLHALQALSLAHTANIAVGDVIDNGDVKPLHGSLKDRVKRNLSSLQQTLVSFSANDVENRLVDHRGSSDSGTILESSRYAEKAALIEAEAAAAKDRREAFEAWKVTNKKARTAR